MKAFRYLRALVLIVSALLTLTASTAFASSTLEAADVLGQTSGSNVSFTSNAENNGTTTNAVGLNYPYGLALDTVDHRLFVSDCSNNRVLEFDLDSQNHLTHYTADHVLGQMNFTANSTNQGDTASSTTM